MKYDDLPNWTFEVSEVSAGVYCVSGKNKSGISVELTGIDPDKLLSECKDYARKKMKLKF